MEKLLLIAGNSFKYLNSVYIAVMNLNIFKPGQAVKDAIEHPNFVLAMILVLLPSIVAFVAKMNFSEQALAGALGPIVVNAVTFFLLVLVVFVLCKLVGSKSNKSFDGLFSALSLMKIVSLAVVLLSLVAMPLTLSPEAAEFSREKAESKNPGLLEIQVGTFIEENPDAVNMPVLGAFLFITLLFLIFALDLVFTAVKEFTGAKWVTALVITIVAFIIQGILLAIVNGTPML